VTKNVRILRVAVTFEIPDEEPNLEKVFDGLKVLLHQEESVPNVGISISRYVTEVFDGG
jgi:hypothetical protein